MKIIIFAGLFILAFFIGIFLYRNIPILLIVLIGGGIPTIVGIKVANGKIAYWLVFIAGLISSLIIGLFFSKTKNKTSEANPDTMNHSHPVVMTIIKILLFGLLLLVAEILLHFIFELPIGYLLNLEPKATSTLFNKIYIIYIVSSMSAITACAITFLIFVRFIHEKHYIYGAIVSVIPILSIFGLFSKEIIDYPLPFIVEAVTLFCSAMIFIRLLTNKQKIKQLYSEP